MHMYLFPGGGESRRGHATHRDLLQCQKRPITCFQEAARAEETS